MPPANRRSSRLGHRAAVAVWLPWLLCVVSCEALFGGQYVDNSENCTKNLALCHAPDEVCNPVTKRCEPPPVPEPELGLDVVEPSSALNTGGDPVTLRGKNFVAGATLRFGGVAASAVSVTSSSTLTAVVPASTARGPVPVELTLPSGQRLARDLFRYVPELALGNAELTKVQASPRILEVVDVNGDGRSDLAITANAANDPIVFLIGQAGGGFARGPDRAFSGRALAISFGDVNRDGKPDLAVADSMSFKVEVFLGVGDGTFTSTPVITVGNLAYGLALVDVNGDKNADLLTIEDRSLFVRIGKGDGTFNAPGTGRSLFTVPALTTNLRVADLDGDGKIDLVASSPLEAKLHTLLGIGDGTFGTDTVLGLGQQPRSMVLGDVNLDGYTDVLMPTQSPLNKVLIALGMAGGRFEKLADVFLDDKADIVVLGDLNSDGLPDLVTTTVSKQSDNVMVLLGLGDLRFSKARLLSAGTTVTSAAVIDVNADGRKDLLTIEQNMGNLWIFRNAAP